MIQLLGDTRLRRKLALLVAGVSVISLLLGRRLVIRPVKERLERVRAALDLERKKAAALHRVVALEGAIARYHTLLLDRRDAAALIEAVNQMAEESRSTLMSVSPLTPEQEGAYVRVPIEVEMQCTYHQLGVFVSRIESAARFMKIEELRVEAQPGSTTPGKGLMVRMSLSGLSWMR